MSDTLSVSGGSAGSESISQPATATTTWLLLWSNKGSRILRKQNSSKKTCFHVPLEEHPKGIQQASGCLELEEIRLAKSESLLLLKSKSRHWHLLYSSATSSPFSGSFFEIHTEGTVTCTKTKLSSQTVVRKVPDYSGTFGILTFTQVLREIFLYNWRLTPNSAHSLKQS